MSGYRAVDLAGSGPLALGADASLSITYAITPPNRTTSEDRRQAIATAHSERLRGLPVDALLVYDLQDEALRNAAPRPFPFVPKVDPLHFAFRELRVGDLPRVVYRAIAGQDAASLRCWLDRLQAYGGLTVFVGAPSHRASPPLTLTEALALGRAHVPAVCFGGVVIAERHAALSPEDARVWAKMDLGCRFFVSQTVWSVGATKQLLHDLGARAAREHRAAPPILITLSPCGSVQTLEFQEWLGVSVPPLVKRELSQAKDMLARSVDLAVHAFTEILDCARAHGVPVGCNVESVSARPAEVEAAVELVRRIDGLRGRATGVGRASPGLAPRSVELPPCSC